MNIPDNYKVLFLQGGASQQFAMIPMNLMKNRVADYIITGQWAKKACSRSRRNTVKLTVSHPLKIRHFLISRIALIFRFLKMQIMYIFVKIIRFMEQNSRTSEYQRARRW